MDGWSLQLYLIKQEIGGEVFNCGKMAYNGGKCNGHNVSVRKSPVSVYAQTRLLIYAFVFKAAATETAIAKRAN